MVSGLPLAASRLPEETLARLMVLVMLPLPSTVMAVTPESVWEAPEVRVVEADEVPEPGVGRIVDGVGGSHGLGNSRPIYRVEAFKQLGLGISCSQRTVIRKGDRR